MFVKVTSAQQIEIIERLAREIWTGHYTSIVGKEQISYMLSKFQSIQAISEQIANGALYFLIRTKGHSIGYMSVVPKENELFLSKIYIESAHRGKGFARKAVLLAERIAKGHSLGKIVLTVNRNNLGAIRAYERLGFRNTGPVIQDIGHGFVMDDYRMEKILSV